MKALVIVILVGMAMSAQAQTNAPTFLPFQAQLTDASDVPYISTPVTIVVQITNTTGCVLYQENQNATTDSKGMVSLAVGSGTGQTFATGTGGIFKNVFRNNGTSITACVGGGTATLTPTEGRKIQFNVNGGGMSTGVDIGSVGSAYYAEKAVDSDNLGGFSAANYLDVNGVASMAAPLKLQSWAAAPGSPALGQLGYNSGSGKLEYYNGAWTQIPTSGTGITSLNGLSGGTQTFANDTNITMSSATTVHTLGWAGTLAMSRGGTGANISPLDGGIIYSGPANLAVTPVGAAGQFLKSNGGGAPSWAAAPADATKLPLNGTGTMTGNLDMGSNQIINLVDGSGAQDAAAFGQISSAVTANNANFVRKDGTTAMTADWDINGATAGGTIKIVGLADPVVADGAATKNYVDGLTTGALQKSGGVMTGAQTFKAGSSGAGGAFAYLQSGVNLAAPTPGALEYDGTNMYYTDGTSTRKTIATAGGGPFLATGGGTMTGAIAMGTNKITGMGDPTAAQDAMTKNYADNTYLKLSGGLMTGSHSLKAGNAGSAPLYFQSGTNMAAPAPGAMEYDGTNYYLTVNGPTRKTIATMTDLGSYLPLAGGQMTGSLGIGVSPSYPLDVAGNINTTGKYNMNGIPVVSSNGNESLYLGKGAGPSDNGSDTTTIGFNAGNAATNISFSVLVGAHAGESLVSGVGSGTNTMVGSMVNRFGTSGQDNVYMGYNAAQNNIGNQNIFIGSTTGASETSASGNTMIGYKAGDTDRTGSNNTFLGKGADTTLTNLTNATAIGANAIVSASNSLVLGPTGTNVGIGTSSPIYQFHIANNGGSANMGMDSYYNTTLDSSIRLRKARGTSGSPTIVNTNDNLGTIQFYGYDGGAFTSGASITSLVSSAPSGSNIPTDLIFKTGNSGAGSEKMRVTATGYVGIGQSAPQAALDVSGHVANSTPQGALNVSGCGTAPNITGNDTRGVVTFGSSVPSSCTVNFSTSYLSPPYCVITPVGDVGSRFWINTATASNFTINLQTGLNGARFNYYCTQ